MTPQNLELFPGDLFARKGDAAPTDGTRKSKAAATALEVAEPEVASEPGDPKASAASDGGAAAEASAADGSGAAVAEDGGARIGRRRGKAKRSKSATKEPSADAAPAASVLQLRLLDEVSEDLDEILRCAEGRAHTSSEPDVSEETSKVETPEIEDHEAPTLEARLPEAGTAELAPESPSPWGPVSRRTLVGIIAISLLLVSVLLASWFANRPDPLRSPADTAPSLTQHGDTSAREVVPSGEDQHKAPAGSASDPKASEGGETRAPTTGNGDGSPPRVDVVRVEDDGSAVIAGTAAPGTELIVLHNDSPLGVAKADAFGEWVLLPEEPLPEGPHEFGLVVKSVEGSVTLPDAAASETDLPAADDLGGETGDPPVLDQDSRLPAPGIKPGQARVHAPVPPQKPIDGSPSKGMALEAPYVVQLASAPSAVDAASEWQRLRKAYPELLAQQDLSLQEADLAGRGAVYRVRTGSFETLAAARRYCAAFRRQKQECLVVKRTEANETGTSRTRLTRNDSW